MVYLESARDLKPDQVIHPLGRKALVIGNPDFSLTPLDPSQVPPVLRDRLVRKIPVTKLEAQMVAEKTGSTPLMRRAADKHALQDCRASIIHIATHGAFFSDEEDDSQEYEYAPNPMRRSCLYFAGANDWLLTGQKDPVLGNGILTAEELCHYRMAPPDLVVLSACFSGMGDIRQGNGIVGLQTAFKVQGARVMLLSIWEADDFASLILMDRFYDNLSSMPAGQALRDAQRYLRTVTIGELDCAGWFDERRFRRIGLVAEDMRRCPASSPPTALCPDPLLGRLHSLRISCFSPVCCDNLLPAPFYWVNMPAEQRQGGFYYGTIALFFSADGQSPGPRDAPQPVGLDTGEAYPVRAAGDAGRRRAEASCPRTMPRHDPAEDEDFEDDLIWDAEDEDEDEDFEDELVWSAEDVGTNMDDAAELDTSEDDILDDLLKMFSSHEDVKDADFRRAQEEIRAELDRRTYHYIAGDIDGSPGFFHPFHGFSSRPF